MTTSESFFAHLEEAIKQTWPKPKMLIISFPHNPTTEVVEVDFFERVVGAAREHRFIVVHDLAYADLVFDGYRAPSFLEIPEAKEVGVEDGEIIASSKGLHIYDYCWDLAKARIGRR